MFELRCQPSECRGVNQLVSLGSVVLMHPHMWQGSEAEGTVMVAIDNLHNSRLLSRCAHVMDINMQKVALAKANKLRTAT